MENKDSDLFRLQHMQECIDKILKLVDNSQNFKAFESDWVAQDAMIRNFEIVGEAANHISLETKENFPEIEWYKIREMRNFMTHEYFGIKLEVIWETAVSNIPKLKQRIQKVIENFSN